MVLRILFLIIMQKSKFIYMILLPLEKTLTSHSVIIHTDLVWSKDQNHYYCNIFIEKCSYQLPKNNENK